MLIEDECMSYRDSCYLRFSNAVLEDGRNWKKVLTVFWECVRHTGGRWDVS